MNSAEHDVAEIDVARICELANVSLDPAELPRFQEQMARIVDYVRTIRELNVDGIEPTAYGQPVHNVFREDTVSSWAPGTEAAMKNAPESHENEFRVPRVVE